MKKTFVSFVVVLFSLPAHGWEHYDGTTSDVHDSGGFVINECENRMAIVAKDAYVNDNVNVAVVGSSASFFRRWKHDTAEQWSDGTVAWWRELNNDYFDGDTLKVSVNGVIHTHDLNLLRQKRKRCRYAFDDKQQKAILESYNDSTFEVQGCNNFSVSMFTTNGEFGERSKQMVLTIDLVDYKLETFRLDIIKTDVDSNGRFGYHARMNRDQMISLFLSEYLEVNIVNTDNSTLRVTENFSLKGLTPRVSRMCKSKT